MSGFVTLSTYRVSPGQEPNPVAKATVRITLFLNFLRSRLQHWLAPVPIVSHLDAWWRAHRAMWFAREREIALWPFLVDRSKNSVEVGAHMGMYTYWLRKFSTHVTAYEPNPENLIYSGRFRGKATVRPCAVSNTAGKATFRIPIRPISGKKVGKDPGVGEIDTFGGTLHPAKELENFVEVEVETVRLDDEGLENIGFMKIEAEGHEMEVLEGAKALIARDRPIMQVAIKDYFTKKPVAESVQEVEKMGYAAFAYTKHGLRPFYELDPKVNFDPKHGHPIFIKNFFFFPIAKKS